MRIFRQVGFSSLPVSIILTISPGMALADDTAAQEFSERAKRLGQEISQQNDERYSRCQKLKQQIQDSKEEGFSNAKMRYRAECQDENFIIDRIE